MQAKILVCFAALVAVAFAERSGCPHPQEAKRLVVERRIVADRQNEGRHVEHIEVDKDIIGRTDLNCITVVSNKGGNTPDMIAFGRNKLGGYSIIVHSRIRTPLNATLYIYAS